MNSSGPTWSRLQTEVFVVFTNKALQTAEESNLDLGACGEPCGPKWRIENRGQSSKRTTRQKESWSASVPFLAFFFIGSCSEGFLGCYDGGSFLGSSNGGIHPRRAKPHPDAFNPGVIRWRGRTLLMYRVGWDAADMYLGELDGDLKPTGKFHHVTVSGVDGCEDARFFVHQDQLYFSYVGYFNHDRHRIPGSVS